MVLRRAAAYGFALAICKAENPASSSVKSTSLQFEGYQIQEFSGAYDASGSKLIFRKIPLIARDHEIRTSRQRAGHELVILGVWRNTGKRGRAHNITLTLKQVHESRDFIRGKSKLGPREDLGVFLQHGGRKARPHKPLLDSKEQQGFVALR